MRRGLIVAGAAVLAGCAGDPFYAPSVAPPAAPVPPPRVRVGDRWTYERLNRYNGQVTAVLTMRVVALGPPLRLEVTDQSGARLPDEVHAAAWQVIEDATYDLPQVFRDPVPMLPARLEAGAAQTIQTRYRVPRSEASFYWSERVHAVGWQRVRVPAGEFDALRVERTIAFDHSDGFRKRSRRSDTLWYAPAVDRWVMREWTGTYFWAVEVRPILREDWTALRLIEHVPARG